MSSPEHQQLVELLDRQFADIGRRFDVIDRRFDGVDRRITELRHEVLGHLDDIYRRFERLEQEYQAIIEALRRIEAGAVDDRGRREALLRELTELRQQVVALQSRVEQIEQRLAPEITPGGP